MTARFVSYYRVSTKGQHLSGLGEDAQKAAVISFVKGGEILAEFYETESGKRNDRPELAKALAYAKKQKAVLVIAKLDRLARNVAFIANLMESKVEFVACDMPAASKFNIHIMAAVAEQEALAISTRTKNALEQARLRGTVLGGIRHDLAVARAANSEKATKHADNVIPIIKDIIAAGVTTQAGIATALNARGIRSSRGGEWSNVTVGRLMKAM